MVKIPRNSIETKTAGVLSETKNVPTILAHKMIDLGLIKSLLRHMNGMGLASQVKITACSWRIQLRIREGED
jgi:hypothetical protein